MNFDRKLDQNGMEILTHPASASIASMKNFETKIGGYRPFRRFVIDESIGESCYGITGRISLNKKMDASFRFNR